ncbi:MAG: alanine racemase [Burkholderiaceae bacterium]|nr:alanine racemase [Burkholderiaceae bacterium]
MARPSQALIDLAALRHNYLLARQMHGGRALAVIKANAYGHGAVRCAAALSDVADGFAVAFVEEAVALRQAGITQPILVLEGAFDAEDMAAIQAHALWTVVHQASQITLLERALRDQASPGNPLAVWLKLDSGMRRAGFPLAEASAAHKRLQACTNVADITLMSHFARADEPDVDATARQIADFDRATAHLPGAHSLCNSAGVLCWPAARRDWARPGILLYGADPTPIKHKLQPVMTLQSEVFAVRELKAGEALGYGGGFKADRDMRIGLVAMGYADGYPRTAPAGTPVAVDGQLTRLVGRVSMDMLTVDLSDLPPAGAGSRIELWGKQVSVNDVAGRVGTIAYELLCNVKRVPLVYVNQPSL